jgi:WD40 repeat protein/serine/threonine protein kinase
LEPNVLTCPHCKQPLTDADLAKQQCPHCRQRVVLGKATIDTIRGQATIDAPLPDASRDSTMTEDDKVTLVGDRELSRTIDSTELPPASGDPRLSNTIESSDLPPAAADPRLSHTLDSGELPPSPSDPGLSHTIDSADLASADPAAASRSQAGGSSGSHNLPSQTIDSVVAPGRPSPGSSVGSPQVRTSRDQGPQPPSVDDVDRRLRQVWGSQMASARPHVTMRGSASGEEREENTTLIIRERAVRSATEAAPVALADYDLLGVLGEGGMGVVYNARQASIDREVAVKMLKPDMSDSPAQRRKFLSEAAVTGELDHPNIVPIYDLGQNADGALFYSMKKVTGTPWSEVIGQKSVLDNLTILMKVADAVAFAHARGVVHRDLKPENVMLGDFGEVLVLDWGLAVATDGHRPTPNVSVAFNIAGTPAYMAPELAFGPMEAIGRHSDIYLLGAILFECITGRPPHSGKSARDCLKAAARNQIVATEKSGELIDIAKKAMATDIAQRYPTVQAFQDAIKSYQAHSESIALCERAEAGLAQAAQSNDYQDYSRALFAYEEAAQLWPGNEPAKKGVSRARLHYATCALGKSDFDLGLSLIHADDPSHELVGQQLRAAKAERDARQQRLARARRMMVGLAALVFLAVSVGVVVASYLAVEARESEGRAVASAKVAKDNADLAKEKEQTAISEAKRAKKAEDDAEIRREEAIASAYTALIAMAAARIDENAFDQARAALEQCDARHRGWEWRRLWHVVKQGDVTQFELPSRAETLAANPDGNLIATGSVDGMVLVWSKSRRAIAAKHKFGDGKVRVTALAFHPQDDRWVVVGLSEGPAPLVAWNRETEELRLPAHGHQHTGGVVQVAIARDGQLLLTASHDRTARLWNWETLVPKILKGHTGTVWSAAFAPDGTMIATASDDGTVRLWDTAAGTQMRTSADELVPFTQHQGPVYSVTFLPPPMRTASPEPPAGDQAPTRTNYYLATAGYDKRVLLWQANQLVPFDFQALVSDRPVAQTVFQELNGHSAAIRSLAISDDGSRLASAAADHTVRIWQIRETGLIRRGTLVKELRGHAGPVYAAAFLGGGDVEMASTGYDNRVRLWNIDQYQEQQMIPGLALRGHSGAVLSARFAPQGQEVVTASLDRTARTWHVAAAAPKRVFREGHSYLASRVRFFPRSRRLLTAGGDGTVRIWSLDRQAELLVLERTGYRAATAVSPDESLILTGSNDLLGDAERPHGAILWDAASGKRIHPLVGPHKAPVTCVAFSPAADVALVLTADDNGVFQLWNPSTGTAVGPRIDQHGSPIVAAEFAPSGKGVVTADVAGQVIHWDLANPLAITKLEAFAHPAGVLSLAIAPDGRHVLTGGADGRVRLFKSGERESIWTAEPLAVQSANFVSTGPTPIETIPAVAIGWDAARQVVVAVVLDSLRQSVAGAGELEDEFVRLFELDLAGKSYTEVTRTKAGGATSDEASERSWLDLRKRGVVGWSVAISADAREIATVGRDEARVFGRDGSELSAYRPHQDLTFAEFSHAGDLVVTASLDNSVRVWDAATGQPRLTLDEHSAGPLNGHRGAVNCALFSRDGLHVFTASEDGTVRQWELATLRVKQVIKVDDSGVTRLALTRDNDRLLTASRSGRAAVWNLSDPTQPALRLERHTGAVLDICLSADEQWIVTGSADNTARIWNAATGEDVLELAGGHASEVTAVAVLDDRPGLRVLTGSSDKTAKLWAVSGLKGTSAGPPQAKGLLTLRGHSREITSVAFAPGGRAALTAGRDGLSILWPAAEASD